MPEISQLKIAGVVYDIKDTTARNKTLESSDAAYIDFTYLSPEYDAVTTILTYDTFVPPVAVQDNTGKVYFIQKQTLVRSNDVWKLTLANYLVYAGQTVPVDTWRTWFLVGAALGPVASSGGVTQQRVRQLIAAHNQSDSAHVDIRNLIPTDVSQLSDSQGLLGGGVQSDWNVTDTSSKAYIKNKPTIPAALSQLSDDATHRLVTDTQKATWNGKQNQITSSNKLSYTLLSDTPTIPSTLSQLSQDDTHKVVTVTQKATWNGKQAAITASNKLSYTLLSDTPVIPTDISQLSDSQGLLGGWVQSDWAQSDSTQKSYIKNKPNLSTKNYTDFTSSDLVNNVLTVENQIVPVAIVSDTGVYMPVAANSITYSNGSWSISMLPYLAALNKSSVSGTWRVWFSGGVSYVGTVSPQQCQTIAVSAAKKQALIFG